MSQAKSCRYGHGELKKINGVWTLAEYQRNERPHPSQPDSIIISNDPTGFIFTLRLFKCETCGYIEFCDDEAHYYEH